MTFDTHKDSAQSKRLDYYMSEHSYSRQGKKAAYMVDTLQIQDDDQDGSLFGAAMERLAAREGREIVELPDVSGLPAFEPEEPDSF